MKASSGMKFIDEDEPTNLPHSINSAYLALTSSHNIGSANDGFKNDIQRLIALVMQLESDFTGSSKIALSEDSLKNGLFVISLLGLSGKIQLWKKLDYSEIISSLCANGGGPFIKQLLNGLAKDVHPNNIKSSLSKKRAELTI